MQLTDMVKLIYQNEFAGGHLIADKKQSLGRLKDERAGLKEGHFADSSSNTFAYIGNGLCRLNLAGAFSRGMDVVTVNNFFVNTASSIDGNIESLEAKLALLRQCCIEKSLPYSLEDIDAYLDKYRSRGYPPVSHSPIYNNAYWPSYRIVGAEYCHYLAIFSQIDALGKIRDTVNVAIDGHAAAGKTTLASLLADIYDCNVFPMDHFFLRPELKTRERLKEVGGNVDYIRFKREVIDRLQRGGEFKYRPYDCKKMTLDKYIEVQPKPINIIEGVYSMHPTLIEGYDLKIFLHIAGEEQGRRILKRNGPAMQRRFLKEWIPLENEYFLKLKIKEQSDLVIMGYTGEHTSARLGKK